MAIFIFPRCMGKGSSGPAVQFLQIVLKLTGCDNPCLKIDGFYGEETEKSVKCLQHLTGAFEDGVFGPETMAAFEVLFGVDLKELKLDSFHGETVAVFPRQLEAA